MSDIDRSIRRKTEYLREDFIDELSDYEIKITDEEIEPFCFDINTTPLSYRNCDVNDMKDKIRSVLNEKFKKLGKKPFIYSAMGIYLLYNSNEYGREEVKNKHSKIPDTDNVQKAVWDSCCGLLICDDKPIPTSTSGYNFIDGESKIIIFGHGAYE